jgi:hypothetical protein
MCDDSGDGGSYASAAATLVNAANSAQQAQQANSTAKSVANATAAKQTAAEKARQEELTRGYAAIDQNFGQFNDNFYNGRARAYTDYANPQLDDQYGRARNSLIYALTDAGTLGSSAGADKLALLERDYSTNKQSIADQAAAYASEARTNVGNARAAVTRDLVNGGNAGQAGAAAAQQAQTVSAAPSFSPLAQLFQNMTAGIGSAAGANQNAALLANGTGQTPTFRVGTGSGSGRVVSG